MTRRAAARYSIEADDSKARAAIDRTKRGFVDTEVVAKRLGGTLVRIAGVAGFGALAGSALDAADNIAKLSRDTGLSTEFLSQMRGVLELVGGDFNALTSGTDAFAKVLLNAERGLARAERSFEELGLSAGDFVGLSVEERLELVLNALRGVDDQSRRSAIAQELFSGSYRTFLRLAEQTPGALREMREEQVKAGRSMSEDMVEGAEAANDALAKLKQSLGGLAETAVLEFGDEAATVLDTLAAGIRAAGQGLPGGRQPGDLSTILQFQPFAEGGGAAFQSRLRDIEGTGGVRVGRGLTDRFGTPQSSEELRALADALKASVEVQREQLVKQEEIASNTRGGLEFK